MYTVKVPEVTTFIIPSQLPIRFMTRLNELDLTMISDRKIISYLLARKTLHWKWALKLIIHIGIFLELLILVSSKIFLFLSTSSKLFLFDAIAYIFYTKIMILNFKVCWRINKYNTYRKFENATKKNTVKITMLFERIVEGTPDFWQRARGKVVSCAFFPLQYLKIIWIFRIYFFRGRL